MKKSSQSLDFRRPSEYVCTLGSWGVLQGLASLLALEAGLL